jgi:hypothetical protein
MVQPQTAVQAQGTGMTKICKGSICVARMVDCTDAHADRMGVQRSWSAFLQASFNVSKFAPEPSRYLAALSTQIFIRRLAITASAVLRVAGMPPELPAKLPTELMGNDPIQAEMAQSQYLPTPVWV